jgi:hypothetical protein
MKTNKYDCCSRAERKLFAEWKSRFWWLTFTEGNASAASASRRLRWVIFVPRSRWEQGPEES